MMTTMTFIMSSAIKSGVMILLLWGMRSILRRFVSPRIRAALWGLVPLVILCPGFFALPILPPIEETSLPQESVSQKSDDSSAQTPSPTEPELKIDQESQNLPVPSTTTFTEAQGSAILSEETDSLKNLSPSASSENELAGPTNPDDEFELLTQTETKRGEITPILQETSSQETSEPNDSANISSQTSRSTKYLAILSATGRLIRQITDFFNRYTAQLEILWGIGVTVSAIRMISGICQCRRWVHLAAPNEDEKLQALLVSSGESLGLKRLPPLLLTVDTRSPAMTGIFKPALLLPADMAETFSEESLRHIFLHELGHFARRDLLAGTIGSLLLSLYWFNPLFWIARKGFYADQEEACDALVLGISCPPARRDYANTFYEIIRRQAAVPLPTGSAGMVSDIKTIENRIKTMAFEGKWEKGRLILVLIPLLASTASLSALSFTVTLNPSASVLTASAISMPLEDIMPNASSSRSAPMDAPADPETETIADKAEAARILSEIENLAVQPFEGETSNYLIFLREKGKKLTQLSHLCLTCPDLSRQETQNALVKGILGCMLTADTEEEDLQKRKSFLDAHADRPETIPFYHAWIQDSFTQIQDTLEHSSYSIDEKKEILRQTVGSMIQPIALCRPNDRHYYSNPKEKIEFESIPYTLLQMGETLDPDYSQGFAVEIAQKLKPVFEIDLQSESMTNKSNAVKGLQTASRAAITGKTLQYEGVDFANQPVSLSQFAGKPALILFTNTLSQDADVLHKIYQELHSDGLQMIVHSLNNFKSNPRQNPNEPDSYPWITIYQSLQNGVENYPEKFGVFDGGVLLVNAQHKLILNRSDAFSSEMCDTLAQIYPQHTAFLEDCKNDIDALNFSKRQNNDNSIKIKLSSPSQSAQFLPNFLQNTEFGSLIRLENRFQRVNYSTLISYGFNTERQLEFFTHLLSLPESKESSQYTYLLVERYNLLNQLASQKSRNNSSDPPEHFYDEADQFARDYLFQEKLDFRMQQALEEGQKMRINSMCSYLTSLSEGQEEYAKKIVDRFVDYHQQNEEKLIAGEDSLFSSSWTSGIRLLSEAFREIDQKKQTHLENALYQRVDPYFAGLMDNESNLLENFKKRASRP